MRSALGALALAFFGFVAPESAVAATSIVFRMYIGQECANGVAKPDAQVHVAWRAAGGAQKADATVVSDASGYWSLCLAPGGRVEIGDRFDVTAGSQHRRFTVPSLTLEFDRVRDLILGTGPAGTTIDLGFFYCCGSDTGESEQLPIGSDGNWQFDPLRPVSDAWLNWFGDGDSISIDTTYPPELIVLLNSARFTGYTNHFRDVHVFVLDSSGVERGMGTAVGDESGRFSGVIKNANGRALKVRAGDRVVASDLAPNADWIMPHIGATADIADDTVSGQCEVTETFAGFASAQVYRSSGRPRGSTHRGNTDDAGNFLIHMRTGDRFFSFPANIKRGDQVKVDCAQTSGDAARLTFIAR